MFWSTPACPVEEEDKLWIEESMQWLLEEFGRETFREITIVLPTDEFFPDEYFGEEEDAEALVDRVCGYMKVDRERLEVEFFEDQYGEFQRSLCFKEGSLKGQVVTTKNVATDLLFHWNLLNSAIP